MKILCDHERLREGLTVASSVIPLKSTRPAVENVCLVATDDALELIGTDLDVAVRYHIDDVKVQEPGTALVPARVAEEVQDGVFRADLKPSFAILSLIGMCLFPAIAQPVLGPARPSAVR